MIDYKKELLNFLDSRSFKTLPAQEIIDSEPEFALVVWKNFWPHSREDTDYYDSDELFKQVGWSRILNHYSKDIEFWKKAFTLEHHGHEVLLKPEFQEEFPFICQTFFQNPDLLQTAYEATKNMEFVKLMNLSTEEYDKIYKYEHLAHEYSVSQEDITKYESDLEFVKLILTKQPHHYEKLNEVNKENLQLIKLALEKKEMFFEVPEKLRENTHIFNYWLQKHAAHTHHKEALMLNEQQKVELFKLNPQLLVTYIQHHPKDEYLLIEQMKENIFSVFNSIPKNQLADKKFQNKLLNDEKIRTQITQWIENFSSAKPFGTLEEKFYTFIKNDKKFNTLMEGNLFLKVNILRFTKQRINLGGFNHFTQEVLETYKAGKINADKGQELIQAFKLVCDIETMKQLPKTKNIFGTLITEDFKKELPINDIKIKKPKI